MAYSNNILPKSAAYYTLNNASIIGSTLTIEPGGSAEIQLSNQMLPKLTEKMRVDIVPSAFSSPYTNDSLQVTISIVTESGSYINYLIPVSNNLSGVFSTELQLPEEDYTVFTYTVYSATSAVLSDWTLCPQQAEDLTTVINGVEQSLPKLLKDYNTTSIEVSQDEYAVGIISCYLQANTDLQGHFLMDFESSEYCNVVLRFKDNGMSELFCPLTFTVQPGHNTLTVPHAYLNRLAGIHNIIVTAQCTNGTLYIHPRDILFTIDGGYLAEHLLDADMLIFDVSIRQTRPSNGPDSVWAVGKSGDSILLKNIDYNSINEGSAWSSVYTFDNSITAAVEFDCDWVRLEKETTFTMHTKEWPIVALVNANKELLFYMHDGEQYVFNSRVDNNVTQVSLVRGFKSAIYPEQDQGVVCAYIKADGTCWYTHYIYDSTVSYYRWTKPIQLGSSTTCVYVNVDRLNDYRIGIMVTSAEGNIWYVTNRTYVVQAAPSEYASINLEAFDNLFYIGPAIDFNLNATQVPYESAILPNTLYGIYDMKVSARSDYSVYDVFTVYYNDAETMDFEVYHEDNKIGIVYLGEVKQGDRFRVVFNNANNIFILDATGQGHGRYLNGYDFTWTPTYRTNYSEEAHIALNGYSVAISQIPLVNITNNAPAESVTIRNTELTSSINPIEIFIDSIAQPHESATIVYAGITESIQMVQTGTSPI